MIYNACCNLLKTSYLALACNNTILLMICFSSPFYKAMTYQFLLVPSSVNGLTGHDGGHPHPRSQFQIISQLINAITHLFSQSKTACYPFKFDIAPKATYWLFQVHCKTEWSLCNAIKKRPTFYKQRAHSMGLNLPVQEECDIPSALYQKRLLLQTSLQNSQPMTIIVSVP
jgi:hypothetical protein